MKAVILAGGLGTRISEETSTRPKPMIEIGGMPMGNGRTRLTWLRWQPDSALSVWFRARVGAMGGRIKKIMIVALARKLNSAASSVMVLSRSRPLIR